MLKIRIMLSAIVLIWSAYGPAAYSAPRFEISFPRSAHARPITGRVILMISRDATPEVRLQVAPIMFGVDVNGLQPEQDVMVDETVPGALLGSLKAIPPGDYCVQAVLNVYTEFHRADGHVIWAHMDLWEGQKFNISPGNLHSTVQRVRIDPTAENRISLRLTETTPPIATEPDTQWVKRIKIRSKLRTKFWGHPISPTGPIQPFRNLGGISLLWIQSNPQRSSHNNPSALGETVQPCRSASARPLVNHNSGKLAKLGVWARPNDLWKSSISTGAARANLRWRPPTGT